MKRTLILFALAAGLLAAAAPATAATAFKGVVVAKDAQRGTVVTASADGVVRTARSPKAASFRVGQRLTVTGTRLGDGTFRAASVKASGRAKTARVKAVVVRWQKAQRRLLVSAGGSTFVLVRSAKGRTLASATETVPQPGDQISATVNVAAGTARATAVTTVGHLGTIEVEGIVTKLAADSVELVVAKSGFVTFALPTGFVLPAGLVAFDKVSAKVSVGVDGKLTLISLHADGDHGDDEDEDDDDDHDDEDDEHEDDDHEDDDHEDDDGDDD